MKYFGQDIEELTEFLDFIEEDIENVRRVLAFLEDKDIDPELRVHAKSETAEESASHTDVELGQIVKTLVFKTGDSFVAVLCPGDKRVDEEKLSELTESEVRMANPVEVTEKTGYVVGGVSPFDLEIPLYMEELILSHEYVRPAAGSRVIGVRIKSDKLEEISSKTISITE